VLVNGTTIGTITDAEGKFGIKAVPADAKEIIVTFLGFSTASAPVQVEPLHIVMKEDTHFLDETIVVAYGTATKSSFTGSAAMVKAETIENRVTSSVTNALSGTTPGVQVIGASGDPTSSGGSIRIRGFGSMSASNAPLYIVDGMPYDGSIADINPSDVESMSVLKDAAASAIYGARGANGVVLITTKKATSSDAVVKFDAKWGSNSRLIPQYDVITDPAEYYETHYKMMYNGQIYAGKTPAEAYAFADANLFDEKNGGLGYKVFSVPEGQKFIGTNFKLNPNATLGYSDGTYTYIPDNWYNETFHNSFRQEYNLSVSGRKDKFSYYASAGFLQDGGVVNNSDYKRFTTRINADYQAKKWLKLTTNVSYSHSDAVSASYDGDYGSSGN
jgi:TonB-linked SusC/RagA family outer membrane protein